jgi:DNA-binding NtrC family response regulator
MADWSTEPLDRAALLGEAPASGRWKLEVITGPDVGRWTHIDAPLELGTDPTAGFALSDRTVSRRHALLQPGGDGLRMKELGSTNGILLNGVRVQDFVAHGETLIGIGKTLLRLSWETPASVAPEPVSFGEAIGTSPKMRELFGTLAKLSASGFNVLLVGETGTGKDLLARAIHDASRRAGPLVTLDCGAVAPELVDSELFGHEPGAFTGATERRPGAFVRADRGTLYLDGVGELPLALQPKLLRALEARTVQPLGGNAPRTVNVRIIAATHRDLEAAVAAGTFREDLYFRLAVASLHLPPLRERREDIPLLVRSFVSGLSRPDFQLSPSLLDRLERHPWPGNVRELRNVVERSLLGLRVELASGSSHAKRVQRESEELRELPFKEAKDRLFEAFTREYFETLLERCGRNVSKMARVAGIARPYAHRLVKKYGLKSEGD